MFFIIAIFFIINCANQKTVYTNNSGGYKKENFNISVEHAVYHENDSLTQLFLNFSNQNLVYKRPDTSQFFYSNVKITYYLTQDVKSKKISDSASVIIYDRQPEKINIKQLEIFFNIKALQGQKYALKLNIADRNKKVENTTQIEINKSTRFNKQNFLLQSSAGKILYTNNFFSGDTVFVKNNSASSKALIDFFNRDYLPAPPPFSLTDKRNFNYTADSSFVLENSENGFKVIMPQKGFYFLRLNKEVNEGFTLFTVDASFPGIKDQTEMIKSTRYIMSKKEFDNCMQAQNKKEAIDEFWKEIGGSNERAKELLKKYYNRVQEANTLFTSYKQGWQTDRGMIYIVFGSPNIMYKSTLGELWIYGNEAQQNALRFDFTGVDNPFTDNDYILQRSEYYKEVWYKAVDYWRQGHIYMDN